MMEDWFTTEQIDSETYVISEYGHWEETHCYLLNGSEKSLLIDTGLGVANIYKEVVKITDNPITVVVTHCHWDHIGGLNYFSDFAVPIQEISWIQEKFPLPIDMVKRLLARDCSLPEGFHIDNYEIFQGTPNRILNNGDTISLGNRIIEVIHTPGHSPGHMCFYEKDREYLFTGDLIYKGTLFANYESTNPKEYLKSLETVAQLSVNRLFPGHHSLDIQPKLMSCMKDSLKQLGAEEKLCHGSGKYTYEDWEIIL